MGSFSPLNPYFIGVEIVSLVQFLSLSVCINVVLGTSTHHLPPVKAPTGTKKKSSKHCFLCGKKTGLATSYECRYSAFSLRIPQYEFFISLQEGS